MLERGEGTLSIRRQCRLLSVTRSGVYRPQRPVSDDDISLMRRIDELFTGAPVFWFAADDAATGLGRP
jgi:putative transposase